MTELELNRVAPPEHDLDFDDLIDELRLRRWTLVMWGPEQDPALLAGYFNWNDATDVVIIRPDQSGAAYRCSAAVANWMRPDHVVFQWAGPALWALRIVLALAPPGHVDAPTTPEPPQQSSAIPVDLPEPVVIRPLGGR